MKGKSSSKIDWQLLTPLLVTILIAVSGYVYSHYSQLANDQREAKLRRVNDQLRYLYGPLYSFSKVTYRTWVEFKKFNRPNISNYWDDEAPPNAAEQQANRFYMIEVIGPYHVRFEAALHEYSDLIIEKEMPKVLLDLAANIADSKALYAAWNRSDYSRHIPFNAYPVELDSYAREKYLELKSRQLMLIGVNNSASKSSISETQ
jgi:hypothetical protein